MIKIKEKKYHWANKKEEKRNINYKFKKYFSLYTVCNILGVFFLAVSVYALFFTDFLEISKINIEGNNAISSEKIIASFREETDDKYLKIFYKRNFIFIKTANLEKKIKERFKRIKKISIEKKFPNQLMIKIEERNLILSLCSRGDCYFIDENGYAYEGADFESQDVREIKLIKLIDESGKEIREGEYVLMPKYVNFIINIENEIKNSINLEILNEYRTQSRISEEVIVQTKKGWDIYLNSKFPIDKSVRTLKTLLNRQIMLRDLNDLEYIDLRSENKVFYRMIGGVVLEEETKKEEELNKALEKKVEEKFLEKD